MGCVSRKLFESALAPEYEAVPADEPPVTIFVGGQPGAGKSRSQRQAALMHPGKHVIPIIGDDFRLFHDDYRRLVTEEPLRMPDVTAKLAGELVGMSVAWANAHGRSCLVEGTWRNPPTVLEAARDARLAGRQTHAVLVCVSPLVSRVSALARFYGERDPSMARWTPPEAHEAALSGIPVTVERVRASGLFDRMSVLARSGSIVYDGVDAGAWAESFLAHWHDFGGVERSIVDGLMPVVEAGVAASTPHMRWIIDYARCSTDGPVDIASFANRARRHP